MFSVDILVPCRYPDSYGLLLTVHAQSLTSGLRNHLTLHPLQPTPRPQDMNSLVVLPFWRLSFSLGSGPHSLLTHWCVGRVWSRLKFVKQRPSCILHWKPAPCIHLGFRDTGIAFDSFTGNPIFPQTTGDWRIFAQWCLCLLCWSASASPASAFLAHQNL